ncbi:MAG: TetR/AcrR family transcriptional regulator [Bacillota bacterium]
MPKDTFFNLPDNKRDRILTIALEEFADKPYEQGSVTAIAQRAQIAKGSIYQYFEDKKDLYLYLLKVGSDAKLEYLIARQPTDWSDFFKAYYQAMLVGAEYDLRNYQFVSLVDKVLQSPFREECLAMLKKMSGEYLQILISAAQAAGQVRHDMPVQYIVYFLNTLSTEFGRLVAAELGLDVTMLYHEEHREKLAAIDINPMLSYLMELIRHGIAQPHEPAPQLDGGRA